MKIDITSEAEKYIAQNGKEAFIVLSKFNGCCGVATPRPKISLGRPINYSLFTPKNYNDIIIFVDKQISESSLVSISLSKLLWFKSLYLELIE